jgi:hypothetical protein
VEWVESVGLMRMWAGVLNVEGGVLMAAAARKHSLPFLLAPSVPVPPPRPPGPRDEEAVPVLSVRPLQAAVR